jgi:5-methylcytosine-specific restriction endonuclease McrA
MCPRHYGSWLRTGSAVKPCAGCGKDLASGLAKYCSESCKPRCSVEGCDGAVRKRGWCASHYAQHTRTATEPVPFQHKWSDFGPCLNCGKDSAGSIHRLYCSDNCRVTYAMYGGPRPTSTSCVACGAEIDLTARNKRGQIQRAVTKFCRPCKRDYNKYKMSAREIAMRDGTDCGICGLPVDMTLARSDGLDCPSVDHILPRSLGGSHDPLNLQLSHLVCNMRKSDRVPLSPAPSAPWREGVVAS